MSKFQKIARVGVIKKNLVSNEIVYNDGYPFYIVQAANRFIRTCRDIDRHIERVTREANKSIDDVVKHKKEAYSEPEISKTISTYPMTFLHRNGINYLSELYDTSSTFKKGEK